jgi:hypothetical protein
MDNELQCLREKLTWLTGVLDERSRRLVLAAEARSLGRGGVERVHWATGVARSTIARGIAELNQPSGPEAARIRRAGGGRKPVSETDRAIVRDLDSLFEPRGRDPSTTPLRWTPKSIRELARELCRMHHPVSPPTVARLLEVSGYNPYDSRPAPRKTDLSERVAQIEFVSARISAQLRARQPVIFVEVKEGGRATDAVGVFHPPRLAGSGTGAGSRLATQFMRSIPAAPPWDPTRGSRWRGIGINTGTAGLALQGIRRWWQRVGRNDYPKASSILVLGNFVNDVSAPPRRWVELLQRFANRTQLSLRVCQLPPGTIKWSSLDSTFMALVGGRRGVEGSARRAVIVRAIGRKRTRAKLRFIAQVIPDVRNAARSMSGSKSALASLRPDKVRPRWNYAVLPRKSEGK